MRRARFPFGAPLLPGAAAILVVLAGCQGKPKSAPELSFERMADTSGLTQGQPLLRAFEPYRMDNGALRVRGKLDFPDGTRLQVAVRRPGERVTVQMVQVFVQGGQFDSPPMIGEQGPLPKQRYAFELTALFTPEWQTPQVLRASDDGRALRGPGITRTRQGVASFHLIEEMSL